MCVSISGRCFLSHHLYGKSANRGECLQPCRYEYDIVDRHQNTQQAGHDKNSNLLRKSHDTNSYSVSQNSHDTNSKNHDFSYNIIDKERGKELVLGRNYVLSPKDLCTMPFIDRLIKAGIDAFKIEGRKRSAEYASVTTECYKKAVMLYEQGRLTTGVKNGFVKKMAAVFNRGFSNGFYFTEPGKSDYANIGGSAATMRKEYLGKVAGFGADNTAIKIESGIVKKGDQLIIEGPETGVVVHKISKMAVGDKISDKAGKQDIIYIKLNKPVKRGDKVYLFKKFNYSRPTNS